MTLYFDTGAVQIYKADARDLGFLADGSVDCVVTSPPYWGLRDYGLEPSAWDGVDGCEHEWAIKEHRDTRGVEGSNLAGRIPYTGGEARLNYREGSCLHCGSWRGTLGLEPTPELYVQHLVQIFREVWRVLKPTGTLWLNMGDSYAANWRGGGVDTASAKQLSNTGTQPFMATNAPKIEGLKPKDLCGIPWRVAFALQTDGWWLRSEIIWAKPNPMPESVTDRPTRSHEYLFLLTKAQRYYYDRLAIAEPLTRPDEGSRKTPARFGGAEKHIEAQKQSRLHSGNEYLGTPTGTRNRRSVWWIATQPYPEAHFATFPEKLVEPCILAGTSERGNCATCGKPWERVVEKQRTRNGEPIPKGGWPQDAAGRLGPQGYGHWRYATEPNTTGWQPTCQCTVDTVPAVVLDPFAGSGTVGAVAQRLGRRAILVDLKPDYCTLAMKRLCK